MNVIEIEPLVAPVSAETPGGADLEFDPGYFELETLARGKAEQVMGEEVKAGEEPAWREVKKAALGLFGRTRDLRVAMILAAALLKEDGLAGFRDGVLVVKGLVEKLWPDVYPKLDPTDNNDPTIRVNILKGFDGDGSAADLYKFKLRLREAVLTNSKQKIGRFSFRDIQVSKGEAPPPPGKDGKPAALPDPALINAAFEDTATEDLQKTQGIVQEAIDGLAAMDAAIGAKAGAGVGPDFTSIKGVLEQLKGTVEGYLVKRGAAAAPAAVPAAVPAAQAGGTGGATAAGARGVALTGEIGSRADVVRVLDKICEYYERFEPTSPVPIFMKRAKKLVTMSFVDVIKELAPDAMQRIEIFTGTPDEEGKR